MLYLNWRVTENVCTCHTVTGVTMGYHHGYREGGAKECPPMSFQEKKF